MKDYLDIALEACTKAGDIIRENFHKKKLIDYKGRINLVTNVDREAEKVVVETIRKIPVRNTAGSSILWTAPRIMCMGFHLCAYPLHCRKTMKVL